MPSTPILPSVRNCGCSLVHLHRVFDHVGDLRRDLELLQVGRGNGQHAEAGGREVFGQADESRFVDAVAMHAGHQQDGAAALPAPADRNAPGMSPSRVGTAMSGSRVTAVVRQAATRRRAARQIGGANDEAERVEIGEGEETDNDEERERDRRLAAAGQRHARMVH